MQRIQFLLHQNGLSLYPQERMNWTPILAEMVKTLQNREERRVESQDQEPYRRVA